MKINSTRRSVSYYIRKYRATREKKKKNVFHLFGVFFFFIFCHPQTRTRVRTNRKPFGVPVFVFNIYKKNRFDTPDILMFE